MTPLVFIHAFDSDYLAYTVRNAVLSGFDVTVLGDVHNKYVQKLGAKHKDWNYYDTGAFIGENILVGHLHMRPGWTRFNWIRFFVLIAYMNYHNLEWIWYFDSDVWVHHGLINYEEQIKLFGGSEGEAGSRPQGLINRSLLSDWVNYSFNLLQSNQLEKEILSIPDRSPTYAMTEMESWARYRKEKIKTPLFEIPNKFAYAYNLSNTSLCGFHALFEDRWGLKQMPGYVDKVHFKL